MPAGLSPLDPPSPAVPPIETTHREGSTLRRIRRWAIALALGLAAPAGAVAQGVDVYVFWRAGCPHCERELEFLERLGTVEPHVRVHASRWSGAPRDAGCSSAPASRWEPTSARSRSP